MGVDRNGYVCPYLVFFSEEKLTIKVALTQSAFTWSKLTIETLEQGVKYVKTTMTPERQDWRRSGVFIVNFEHILHLVLVFLLLTLRG